MCMKHDKLLELFCKTDQMCLCMLCTVLDHKSHDVAPVKEQYERNLAKLGKTRAIIQQMIKTRQFKIQEFKDSVSISREIADREIAIRNHVFTKLKEAIERHQAKLIESTEEKHRMTEKQAEGFIKEMEQEISELKKRSSELEQFLLLEDHLDFLQNFSSLDAAPPTKNWTKVKVCPPSYEGTVGTAVDQLVEMVKKQVKKFLKESEMKTVQQYAVDVTLDPDTANPRLILSEDGKQVSDGTVWKDLRHNPKRFSHGVCVLGKQFVSSGRFYFEVQVKGKPDWGLGVAAESVNRKGPITASPNNGYWTIHSRKGNFCHLFTESLVRLSQKSKPEKVGVFVDYDEGLVSFYDVDAAALIDAHIGCSFTGKLHPVFLPCANQGGKNSAPLIICPVNPT
ncbi:zinc finger protein RFP-like [Epinephelus moara]|uniref:zinc finger protein RFP-like n=1 Tax=Epinephelus moara TaxID=300413 RepID=UPI00214EDA0E|nr:zinc finger protein RFP-like [Epinephelus moara]